eukprot:scaffold22740_cov139-Cylindrotheca_fusiformis.AAC.5
MDSAYQMERPIERNCFFRTATTAMKRRRAYSNSDCGHGGAVHHWPGGWVGDGLGCITDDNPSASTANPIDHMTDGSSIRTKKSYSISEPGATDLALQSHTRQIRGD